MKGVQGNLWSQGLGCPGCSPFQCWTAFRAVDDFVAGKGWHGSRGGVRVISFFCWWRESQFWGRNSWTSLFFGWWNEFWEDLTRCFCVSKGWTWSHEWQHLQLLPRNVECVEKLLSAVAAQGIEEWQYYCTKSDHFSSKSWKFESCQFHLMPRFHDIVISPPRALMAYEWVLKVMFVQEKMTMWTYLKFYQPWKQEVLQPCLG